MKPRNIREVAGLSIPDDDMPGWIQQLHEMGLDQSEIDRILNHLNETYAKQKGAKRTLGKKDNFIRQTIEQKRRKSMTDGEINAVDKIFEEALKKLGFKDEEPEE